MKTRDLMNINPEAYKRSGAPSRSMWKYNDIIPMIYIHYSHNVYTDGKPRISSFQLYVLCQAIPKPWQVQPEINIKIRVEFFAKFVLTFVLLNLIYL